MIVSVLIGIKGFLLPRNNFYSSMWGTALVYFWTRVRELVPGKKGVIVDSAGWQKVTLYNDIRTNIRGQLRWT